jgi:putative ABC transport system permease protein
MDVLIQDIRTGLRSLHKSRGVTAMIVLMLGSAIGINTTVFCWIEGIILRPLPGATHASRLVAIIASFDKRSATSSVSYPDLRALTDLKAVFSGVMASSYGPALLDINGENEWTYGRVATANWMEVLGIKPELGRSFLPGEDEGTGGHPVLLISDGLWRNKFGGTADVIGKSIRLNQHLFTIIGVVPPRLIGLGEGLRTDFWAPLSMYNEVLNYGSFESHTFRWLLPLARLRPGVSIAQARAALNLLSSQLQQAFPDSNKTVELQLFPLWKSPLGRHAAFLPMLRILIAVAFGLLLIVIVNVVNLMLARMTNREREVAVRLALGAGRLRLIRQFVTETTLLALLGGAFGILLAIHGVELFDFFEPKTNLPLRYNFTLDAATLAFTAGLTLAAGIIVGLAQAWQVNEKALAAYLTGAGRDLVGGTQRRWVRDFLVISEVSLALLLLIGAGLCVKGFDKARRVNLGFDPHDMLWTQLTLVANKYSPEKAKLFDRQLRERLNARPGVTAALATTLPLGYLNIPVAVAESEGEVAKNQERPVSFIITSPGYLDVMKIALVEGRDFTESDDAASPNVAIIDETMATQFWPRIDPIGRRFRMAAGVAASDTFTVIGIARFGKYRSLGESPAPLVYLNYEQRPIASLYSGVVMRTRNGRHMMSEALRQEIHELDPTVEPLGMQSMEQYIEPAFEAVRVASTLLAILGVGALALAALGLYGVMAYVVSRRTAEIGVRIALGAQRHDVFQLVMGYGMRLILIGIVTGLIAAFGLTHLLASLLYGVSATDPLTFSIVPLVSVTVACLACYLPALRATQLDPIQALRAE